jgi:uncharacterized protein
VSTAPAQHLAALRWLLLSPPLVVSPDAVAQLACFTPQERASIEQWLQALQADSTALTDWMHTRSEARIGRYAERLLEFYLTYGPQHRLAAAHVRLRSEVNGLTVTHGELDFLLTNTQGQHLHWELAVKFFLCTATGDTATPADFVGPNGVETLAHKWHKLFARQLAHKPPEPWNVHTWQSQAFTRGWMFYQWGSVVPHCAALHADHCKAWWVDWADMHQLPEGQYVHLPRLQWMAIATPLAGDVVLYSRDEMKLHLRQLWGITERGTDAQMIVQLSSSFAQMHRLFVRPVF